MLKVLKPGFYSTIQDTGRFGFRTYGVPVSGAMDRYSAQFANALLGNKEDSALIEMTMVGGVFQCLKPTVISISGADMHPQLNNKPIPINCAIEINSNDILSLGRATNGFRTYLAIKGGLDTEFVLDSRSQFNGISTRNTINKGGELSYKNMASTFHKLHASVKYDSSVLTHHILDAFQGPEYSKLSSNQKELLLKGEYKVSKLNNRMAYQLEPMLKNNLEAILTAPVLPGTVQLTPSGNLMVLMRDCQTTGGYPRVLQLTEKSINILSQKTTGNTVKIRLKD